MEGIKLSRLSVVHSSLGNLYLYIVLKRSHCALSFLLAYQDEDLVGSAGNALARLAGVLGIRHMEEHLSMSKHSSKSNYVCFQITFTQHARLHQMPDYSTGTLRRVGGF